MPKISKLRYAPAMLVGASPMWCARHGKLVYVDINAKALHSYDPSTAASVTIDFTQTEFAEEHITFVVEDNFTGGRSRVDQLLLVGLHQRIISVAMVDPPAILNVYEISMPEDCKVLKSEHRLNCAQFCPRRDELYVGYMHLDWRHDNMGQLVRLRSPQGGSIMAAEPALRKQAGAPRIVHLPNGLAWASSSTLFMVDAAQAEILKIVFVETKAVKCLSENSPQTVYILKDEYVERSYFLGGIAIDRRGTIWAALSGAGLILRIDPISRQEMFKLRLDFDFPTAVCFGGERLDEMYITSRTDVGDCEKNALHVAVLEGVRGLGDYEVVEAEASTKGCMDFMCGIFN